MTSRPQPTRTRVRCRARARPSRRACAYRKLLQLTVEEPATTWPTKPELIGTLNVLGIFGVASILTSDKDGPMVPPCFEGFKALTCRCIVSMPRLNNVIDLG